MIIIADFEIMAQLDLMYKELEGKKYFNPHLLLHRGNYRISKVLKVLNPPNNEDYLIMKVNKQSGRIVITHTYIDIYII